jgi:hypothetical protein
LLALDPADGNVIKRHRVEGTVTAISWAPIGIYITYVVRTANGSNLHLMEGNFTQDRVVARHVTDVIPSWRWDSLAIAYATVDGSVHVLDLGAGRTVAVERPPCAAREDIGQLAFAPYGGRLAVAGAARLGAWIADTTGGRPTVCAGPNEQFRSVLPVYGGGVSWLGQNDLVVTAMQLVTRVHLDGNRVVYGGTLDAPAGINAVTVAPDRRSLAVALVDGRVAVLSVPSMQAGPRDRAELRQVLLNVAQLHASPLHVTLLWR